MRNFRVYGKEPYEIAAVHGGPGAAGEVAPFATELASVRGVLEPFQTETSVAGQIEELKEIMEEAGTPPLYLIGFSWGAWLSFLTAAYYPDCVRKLILIGSGPFEERYASRIHQTRMSRLGAEERSEVESLLDELDVEKNKNSTKDFTRFGEILSKADAYDPISCKGPEIDYNLAVFRRVWKEASEMRRGGMLLRLAGHIRCPVVAIHGDYDPHPAAGVQEPLSTVLPEFRFYLLRKCGHKPWIERAARNEFYSLLRRELDG